MAGSQGTQGTYTENVAGLAAGRFAVAWEDSTGLDGAGYGVYAQRYDAGGGAIAGEFIINTFDVFGYGGNNNDYPSIALRDDGSLIVAWVDHTTNAVEQRIVAGVATAGGVAGTIIDPERHTVVCDGHEVEIEDAAGNWRRCRNPPFPTAGLRPQPPDVLHG